MPYYIDDSTGDIIATSDILVKQPWIIKASSKFKGRHYFFNQRTKESAWSIRQSLIEGYPTSDGRASLPLLKKGSEVEPLPRPQISESLTLPRNGVASSALLITSHVISSRLNEWHINFSASLSPLTE